MGIQGTPATLIGEGLLPGWVPFEQFDEMVSDALKTANLKGRNAPTNRRGNEKLLLLSALATSGLARAADAIPDVVKQFSEQQQIKIIKKLDAPAAHRLAGAISGHGRDAVLTPDGKHVISGYLYDDKGKTSAKAISRKRSTLRWDARCGRTSMRRIP